VRTSVRRVDVEAALAASVLQSALLVSIPLQYQAVTRKAQRAQVVAQVRNQAKLTCTILY